MTAKTVWDLPRNDIAACIEYHDKHPDMTPEEIRIMVKLQDDETQLMEITKGWSRPPTPHHGDWRRGFDA